MSSVSTDAVDELKRRLDECDRLKAINAELLEALETARKCIAYCRQNHPDPQKGEGIPIEFLIDDVIARAKEAS